MIKEDGSARITSEWKAGAQSSAFATAMSGIDYDADWSKAQYNGGSDKPSYAILSAVTAVKNCGNIIYGEGGSSIAANEYVTIVLDNGNIKEGQIQAISNESILTTAGTFEFTVISVIRIPDTPAMRKKYERLSKDVKIQWEK